MPSRDKTSAIHTGPRSDLESHGFAPEFVPTAEEQRLHLFTHIIRAFGITIALVINAIIFVPFFVFGILPLLIKKHFGVTTSNDPFSTPASLGSKTERSQGIFFSRNHRRTKSPNGDVSPLLLSVNTSISDFAPYAERATKFRDVQGNYARLPAPVIDVPTVIGRYATYDEPVIHVTQPSTPGLGFTPYGSSRGSAKSDDGTEGVTDDESLVMKNEQSVHLPVDTTKFSSGHTSGLDIPGHGQDAGGNTVIKREKTGENLHEAVDPNSKML